MSIEAIISFVVPKAKFTGARKMILRQHTNLWRKKRQSMNTKTFKKMKHMDNIELLCPECGKKLEHVIGCVDEETYDGVRCENGCNLWDHYA